MTRNSLYRAWVVVMLVGVATLTGACTAPAAKPAAASTASYGPDVVSLDGLRDIRFGQPPAEMITRGVLRTPEDACGPRLADIPQASPVFAEDKLVLLWFNPPLKTPENVAVGTTVTEVRKAYPDAQALTPPANSYTFPGLLVVRGDKAYLFLHDNSTVQKAIAGYEKYARQLFQTGFGSC